MRKAALGFACLLLSLGLFADFLAAERPIVMTLDGQTYWFPNLVEYDELQGLGAEEISRRLKAEDWALWPPVRFGPNSVRTKSRLAILSAPSAAHPLGTDDRGRDVFARLLHGSRTTLRLALGVGALVFFLGLALGCSSTRKTRLAAMLVGDTITALPGFLLVIVMSGLLGMASIALAALVIALPHIAEAGRVVRAQLEHERAQPYCEAALALGISRAALWRRYLMPAALRPALLSAGVAMATAVLAEAGLSFLGFGAPPPTASWGELLRQAADHDLRYWLALPAGLLVSASTAAILKLSQRDSKVAQAR